VNHRSLVSLRLVAELRESLICVCSLTTEYG
jgi:hypothetical protein